MDEDVGVFLMRVRLPDRPGSLGAVATAMGGVGGDINAVEIVEKGDGVVVDDFIVDLPPGALPENIVTACQTLEGVRVEWISRYPEGGGLQSDLEALERMTADPVHAAETLVSLCPVVFRSHWATLLQLGDGHAAPVYSTTLAPDLTPGGRRHLRPVRRHPPRRPALGLEPGLGRHHPRGHPDHRGPGDRHRPAGRARVPRLRDRPAAPPRRPGEVARPHPPGRGPVVRYGRAMAAMGWADVLALLATIGFGVLSAIIPRRQRRGLRLRHPALPRPSTRSTVALGIAVGQTIGKVLLFYGVRRGKNLPGIRHQRAALRSRPAGPARARAPGRPAGPAGASSARSAGACRSPSSPPSSGIPPLYAVALLAGRDADAAGLLRRRRAGRSARCASCWWPTASAGWARGRALSPGRRLRVGPGPAARLGWPRAEGLQRPQPERGDAARGSGPTLGEWGPQQVPTTRQKRRMRIWVGLALLGTMIAVFLLGWFVYHAMTGSWGFGIGS